MKELFKELHLRNFKILHSLNKIKARNFSSMHDENFIKYRNRFD